MKYKIGDLVKRKGGMPNLFGVITEVYESRIKTTVKVVWFPNDKFSSTECTIEPYFLEKVS